MSFDIFLFRDEHPGGFALQLSGIEGPIPRVGETLSVSVSFRKSPLKFVVDEVIHRITDADERLESVPRICAKISQADFQDLRETKNWNRVEI